MRTCLLETYYWAMFPSSHLDARLPKPRFYVDWSPTQPFMTFEWSWVYKFKNKRIHEILSYVEFVIHELYTSHNLYTNF